MRRGGDRRVARWPERGDHRGHRRAQAAGGPAALRRSTRSSTPAWRTTTTPSVTATRVRTPAPHPGRERRPQTENRVPRTSTSLSGVPTMNLWSAASFATCSSTEPGVELEQLRGSLGGHGHVGAFAEQDRASGRERQHRATVRGSDHATAGAEQPPSSSGACAPDTMTLEPPLTGCATIWPPDATAGAGATARAARREPVAPERGEHDGRSCTEGRGPPAHSSPLPLRGDRARDRSDRLRAFVGVGRGRRRRDRARASTALARRA